MIRFSKTCLFIALLWVVGMTPFQTRVFAASLREIALLPTFGCDLHCQGEVVYDGMRPLCLCYDEAKVLSQGETTRSPNDSRASFVEFAGFLAAEGTLSLRSDPTQYEVWHELSHFRQFQSVGPEAYGSLSSVQKEQFVFELLNNSPRRWNVLNFKQQQHAIDYIQRVGGIR